MAETWAVAWIEHYRRDERIEPRWCVDVEEAVELAMIWEESDGHGVLAVETPDGVLSAEQERDVEPLVRARWAENARRAAEIRPPVTHRVQARVPEVSPGLAEDWRVWGTVEDCRSETEARTEAAEWIEMLGPDRVRVQEVRTHRVRAAS